MWHQVVPCRAGRYRQFYFASVLGLAFFTGGLSYGAEAPPPTPTAADSLFFENRIRPLFANTCYACHGPERAEGNLRLDMPSAVAPQSLRAVLQNRDTAAHPAVDVSAAELEAVLDWISRGSPWPEAGRKRYKRLSMEELIAVTRENHWSFQPVVRPEPHAVAHEAWVKTPVDRFILAGLEQAGLEPSPPADRRVLLRRVYYDLTGLPPSLDAIAAFENDTSADAFAKVVDQLLASPQYGERWARHWLDVARYSDTRGSTFAEDRLFPFSHTYRDYVIRAFNEDLPYDQFILHQLAADQLDLGADKRPLAAMGFLTLGRPFNNNIHDRIDDQIDVVTRGLLGLTVNCARCHDHKFDPIPTADYYSLYGVFRSSVVPQELPLIERPDTSSPAHQEFLVALKKAESAYDTLAAEIRVEIETGAREQIGAYLQAAHEVWNIEPTKEIRALAEERALVASVVQGWRDALRAREGKDDPLFGPWLAFAALDADGFAEAAPDVAQSILARAGSGSSMNSLVAQRFQQAPASMAEVCARYGNLFAEIDAEWKQILKDGGKTRPESLADHEREQLRQVLYGTDYPTHIPADRVEEFASRADRDRLAQRRAGIRKVTYTHFGRPDRAMALEDASTPFAPYIFDRGNASSAGEAVPRQFLAVLSGKNREPFQDGSGRLEMARAIANKDNPLTARVLVNRVWMHLFDQPLVGTPSDFGLQGDTPTHPALLDYLAWQFMADGWSIKTLQRHILLSSTYQQSSTSRAEGRDVDPGNALVWRQNRQRLGFEAMRDSLLASAGNLDLRMGGIATTITEPPFSNRRTVYGEVDREALPSVFRIFDFATPSAHSPQRFETTVPQQALYMMNNPFIAEQARQAVAREDVAAAAEPEERVRQLYRAVLKREPTAREIALGVGFVAGQDVVDPIIPEREAPTWLYGYGTVNTETGRVESFTEFPYWTGEAFQGGETLPAPELGFAMLDRLGGHPGDAQHAVIRRWISPQTSIVSFVGELYHHSSTGDGIRAYVVSSRAGILWEGEVQDGMIPTVVDDSEIQAGDTLDLVVTSKESVQEDGFRWHPRVYYTGDNAANFPKQDWISRFDFEGPPPAPPVPLLPWEQYAQVLLMSNEFMFVD